MSFKVGSANRKDRIAGRFLSQVHAILANAAVEAKKETGRTQADVARELGVDRAVISRILSGGGNPTVRTIGELAGALGYRPQLVLQKIERSRGANQSSSSAANVATVVTQVPASTREQPVFHYGNAARTTRAGG